MRIHRLSLSASKATLLLAACAAALAAAPGLASADWPIYGHDLSNTRDAGVAGPAPSQVPGMRQAWKFSPGTGDFTGTPVIADGVLVAGNFGGWVYALNAATGKVLWSKDLRAPINGSAAIDLHAPHGPTVYVPVAEIGKPRLVALSLRSGAIRWSRTLTVWPGASVYSSPVFWRGSVFVGTSSFQDDSTARGSLLALAEGTGRIRWRTYTVPPGRDGAPIWTTPAIDTKTGRLYTGTGNNYHPPTTDTEDAIVAFDAATGRIVGKYQATSGDSFSIPNNLTGGIDQDFGASANLITSPSGERLVGEGQKSGIYWALDRASLKPVWHTTVGPGGQFGGIICSTAYDGARVYGTEVNTGQVFGLRRSGALAWESANVGIADVSPAAVAHGVVYTVDPAGFLVARDPSTGLILTSRPLGGFSFGGVSAVGRAVYVSVGTGELPRVGPASFDPTAQTGAGAIVAFGDTSASGPVRAASR